MKDDGPVAAAAAALEAADVPIVKSNCFGNNFVIYDSTGDGALAERDLADFAREVTDTQFGIGADNLLVVQSCEPAALAAINEVNRYWEQPPGLDADYLFRMFEPDGREALCCGNGLMCIARYLFESAGIASARIVTEVPFARVGCTTIGMDADGERGWVNLGVPRRLPAEIRRTLPGDEFLGEVQRVRDLRVKFRRHDLQPYAADTEIALDGYLVFTGEPHLVFVLDEAESPIARFGDAIFARSEGNRGGGPIFQRRHGFGSWLVDRIGQYLNAHYAERFPIGINVNFVRRHRQSGAIEFRCFERGIFRETLACGTGAMAVACVARLLTGADERLIDVLPHRCRWFRPEALISVLVDEQGWVLRGQPTQVARIDYRFARTRAAAAPAPWRQVV